MTPFPLSDVTYVCAPIDRMVARLLMSIVLLSQTVAQGPAVVAAKLDTREKQLENLYATYWRTEYKIAMGEPNSRRDRFKKQFVPLSPMILFSKISAARFFPPAPEDTAQAVSCRTRPRKHLSGTETLILARRLSSKKDTAQARLAEKIQGWSALAGRDALAEHLSTLLRGFFPGQFRKRWLPFLRVWLALLLFCLTYFCPSRPQD